MANSVNSESKISKKCTYNDNSVPDNILLKYFYVECFDRADVQGVLSTYIKMG